MTATFAGIDATKHLIGGQWVEGNSDRISTNINPYDDSVIAESKQASIADVDAAYEAAEEGPG